VTDAVVGAQDAQPEVTADETLDVDVSCGVDDAALLCQAFLLADFDFCR
jgi:hypothetical protein